MRFYVSSKTTLQIAASLPEAMRIARHGDHLVKVCECGCGSPAARPSYVVRADGVAVKCV